MLSNAFQCFTIVLCCALVTGKVINGVWSEWGDWGSCDQACGGGTQNRSRNCTGSGDCIGPASSNQTCNNEDCPLSTKVINGVWSEWGDWGSCDQACGGGTQNRSRNCTGSGDCIGPASSNQTCNNEDCPLSNKVAIVVACVGIVMVVIVLLWLCWCKKRCNTNGEDDKTVQLPLKKKKPNRKVVIDCDAGVDDAQAILMALAYPDVLDVVAITTVHGNTSCKNVTLNVLRLLKVANQLTNIPVYKGASKPHTGKRIPASYYHGKDGFGDVGDLCAPGMKYVQSESALEALQRLANEHSGELELICIGPLTNIAQVINKDKQFGQKIKHCYIMGGNYDGVGNITEHAEFNFYADPESANIVLTQLGCKITMACWELVKSCPFSLDWYNNTYIKASTKKVKFIKKIEAKTIAKFYKNPKYKKDAYETPDQMAVAMALNYNVCKDSRKASVSVECKDEKKRGMMRVDWTSKDCRQNITIPKAIDKDLYKSFLESYLEACKSCLHILYFVFKNT